MEQLWQLAISLQCWQGDDVGGFENARQELGVRRRAFDSLAEQGRRLGRVEVREQRPEPPNRGQLAAKSLLGLRDAIAFARGSCVSFTPSMTLRAPLKWPRWGIAVRSTAALPNLSLKPDASPAALTRRPLGAGWLRSMMKRTR